MQKSNCIKEEATSSPTHWLAGSLAMIPWSRLTATISGVFAKIENILGGLASFPGSSQAFCRILYKNGLCFTYYYVAKPGNSSVCYIDSFAWVNVDGAVQ